MKKISLLSATSVIALAAAAASPAHAFDYVDWDWIANVYTDVDSDIRAGAYFYHQGLVQVERIQVKAGDVRAQVDLSNTQVQNEAASSQPVNITQINGSLALQQGAYLDPLADIQQSNSATTNAVTNLEQFNVGIALQTGPINTADIDQSNSAAVAGGDIRQVNLAGVIQAGGTNSAHITQSNTVVVDLDNLAGAAGPINAVDHLGAVEGAATAIQNLASIESEHSTSFHDGQYAFGNMGIPLFTTSVEDDDCNSCGGGQTGNQMHDLLTIASLGAAFGLIDKGEAKATIKANDVYNASVDISAVAAANIHTADVTTDYESYQAPGMSPYYWVTDNVVMGDLTQFAYMDVTAKAEAKNLTLVGYSNLGGIGGPINKATATALGNVSSVINKSPAAQ